jgi:hypothetical protein
MSDEIQRRQKLLADWQQKHPAPTASEIISLLQHLGRPPTVVPGALDPDKIHCACGKDVPCNQANLVNTGQMTAVEPVCPPCRNDFTGQARIVCIRCRVVIGWLDPHTDPHGFRVEADKFYHVGACAICKKGLIKADIIEMMLYYDELGITYDKDLLM